MKSVMLRFGRWVAVAVILLGAALLIQGFYIPLKAVAAQLLLERAWARAEKGERQPKPWWWADTWAVAKIEAPRLGHHVIALDGASGQALAFGPGQLAGTPPVGASGTTIFAGHRDTHFRFLADLRTGDTVIVTAADGHRYDYQVTQTWVTRADASGLDAHSAGPTGSSLALVTCYPFDAVTHGPERYVVWADRVL